MANMLLWSFSVVLAFAMGSQAEMHMHRHLLGLVAHHVVVQLNLQPSGKGHYSWECTTGLVNQLSVLGH